MLKTRIFAPAAIVLLMPVSIVMGNTAIRSVASVNVRSGPSTSYAILGKVPAAGQTYVAVAKSGSWWKISFDGRAGWTHGDYWKGLSGVSGVKVTTSVLNVRSGAGTGYAILGKVYSGQIYYSGASSGGWYQIYWGGRTAWISGMYASRVALSGSTTTTATTTTSSSTSTSSGGSSNLNMTWYRQVTNYFCGPTTSQMVIKYVSGRYYDQWTIARYEGTSSSSGTSAYNVCKGINRYASAGYVVAHTFNRSRAVNNIQRNKPVPINFKTRYLAYTRYYNAMHHSPIKGFTSGGFYVHDSAWGANRWASTTEITNAVNYHYGLYLVRY